MVSERTASPEPVATVIDEREVAAPNRRTSAANPRPRTEGRGLFRIAGDGSGTPQQVRAVSFEASSLVENFSSYKASGKPSRVLYYSGAGGWTDFSGEALASLREAFEIGRTSVELIGVFPGAKKNPTVWSVVDFAAQAQFTKAVRGGDANIKAAWYPSATPDEVDGIVRYGFGAPNCEKFEDRRYGTGVYLIPTQSMHLHHPRCVLPEPDVGGERHLLLCRAVVGTMEKVESGSWQSYPSNDRFDTGADDRVNPTLHIIWKTNMNTHIIPECIVSFSCSGLVARRQVPTRKPVPARNASQPIPLTFLQLYAEIRKFVPPTTMGTLDALLERYKGRKIPKDAFIRQLRSIAGTGVLAETIRKFKDRM